MEIKQIKYLKISQMNPNTSNFTYREAPIQATRQARTFISELQNPAVQAQAGYRPITVNVQSGQHVSHYQKAVPIQSRVIGSRLIEAPRQVSTMAVVAPSQLYVQPSVIHSRPVTQVNVQPVQRVETLYSRPSIPISTIIQGPQPQRFVEEVQVTKPTQAVQYSNEPPEVLEPIVKYEYQEDPVVQTGRTSAWASHYEAKQVAAQPPPAAPKEKGGCNPIICAILGLLALGGLIAGIILALKARSSWGDSSTGISQTPGTGTSMTVAPEQSQYSNYSITVETTVVNTTSVTGSNSSNITNVSVPVVPVSTQVVVKDPITVQPNVTVMSPVVPQIVTFNNATTTAPTSTTTATTTTPTPTSTSTSSTSSTSTTTTTSTTPIISQPVYSSQTSATQPATATSASSTGSQQIGGYFVQPSSPYYYSATPTVNNPVPTTTSTSTGTGTVFMSPSTNTSAGTGTAPTSTTTTTTTTTTSAPGSTTVSTSTGPGSPVYSSDSSAFSAIKTSNTTAQPIVTPAHLTRHRLGATLA